MLVVLRKAAVCAMPILLMSGCIPFVVGSTARPVAPGEVMQSMSFYSVPNSFDELDSARSLPRGGLDSEIRYGLDDRSDLGLRIPSYSGAIINYKRRLNGATADPGVAVAVMGGAGVVNFGDHAHFELSFLASGEEGQFTPYGGIRAMQVVPISRGAVTDQPSVGGFFGIRFGTERFALSPEIGVFHDHSALGIRKGSTIIVPSITVSRIGHQ